MPVITPAMIVPSHAQFGPLSGGGEALGLSMAGKFYLLSSSPSGGGGGFVVLLGSSSGGGSGSWCFLCSLMYRIVHRS